MALSPDLMKAILSMDSYNRGYEAGISSLSSAITTKLGSAKIAENSTAKFGVGVDSAIGFYALAYSYNGETVISYRG